MKTLGKFFLIVMVYVTAVLAFNWLTACHGEVQPSKICYTCHERNVASSKHSAIVGEGYVTKCNVPQDSLYIVTERQINDTTILWHEWYCVKKEQ